MISRKNTPEKLWVDKGTEYGGTFKKFFKEKDIEVNSTMSETKAAFAQICVQIAAICFYIELPQKSINWKISQR